MDKTDKFISELLAKKNQFPKNQESSDAEEAQVKPIQEPVVADPWKDGTKDAQAKRESYGEVINNTPHNGKSSESQSVSQSEFDKQLVILGETIKKYRHHLPEQRKPTILICGKIGNGKSSTINTIFGKQVSEVGHFSRGTDKDEVYEWEANTENINIVDLPGLGDSEKNDKIFQEIYRQHVKQADGFIIVVSPPRPAEYGTLKTVKLLIECGVSSKHIIFGFNKLSNLRYQEQDRLQQVQLDGLIGPITPSHTKAIADAKQAFLNDLSQEIPEASFSESQIIEYDSLSGWNLHKMLHAVIEMLPFEALAKLKQSVDEAQREVKKKEEKQLKRDKQLSLKKEERLKQLEEEVDRIRKQPGTPPELSEMLEEIQKLREEVEALQEKTKNRGTALDKFTKDEKKTEEAFIDKLIDNVGRIIEPFDPNAARAIRAAGEVIRQAAPAVSSFVSDVSTRVVETATAAGKSISHAAGKAWKALTSWW